MDKPGIVLVGVCVYGGGGIHEYELEVLADDVRDPYLGFFFFFLPITSKLFTLYFHARHLFLPHRRRRSTQGTRLILTGGRPWSW